jgi:Ser-tRNA(Ala) deacylase AlaX
MLSRRSYILTILITIKSLYIKQISKISMARFNDINLHTCQIDSYLREGFSKVISCEKVDNFYRVILDDSVLYPEGGGQPYDLGTVNGIEVLKVTKSPETKKSVAVDLVNLVEPGTDVKCIIDWRRRYDFMQQHTAQVCTIYYIITL